MVARSIKYREIKLGLWPLGIMLLCATAILIVNLDRVFNDIPLYASDEGTYLIRSIFRRKLAEDPRIFTGLFSLSNTVYLRIISTVSIFTENILQWVRMINLSLYISGLFLVALLSAWKSNWDRRALVIVMIFSFPYWRFLLTAMPEGTYVFFVCTSIFVFSKYYNERPYLVSVASGVVAALACLTKSQGVILISSICTMVIVQSIFLRTPKYLISIQLAILGLGFFVSGALIQICFGIGSPSPLAFFRSEGYLQYLDPRIERPDGLWIGLLTLFSGAGSVLMLAGIPLAAGAISLHRCIFKKSAGGLPLSADRVAFCLALIYLIATAAMVTVFAYKISFIESETKRLWGRYFEFYIIILWIVSFEIVREEYIISYDMLKKISITLCTVGYLIFALALINGVVLFPWDSSILSAFYVPDNARWPFMMKFPYFGISSIGFFIFILLIWRGYDPKKAIVLLFLLLGIVSTKFDLDWQDTIYEQRTIFRDEMKAATLMLSQHSGKKAIILRGDNIATVGFMIGNGNYSVMNMDKIPEFKFDEFGYDNIIFVDGERRNIPGWYSLFRGSRITALSRSKIEVP